MKIRPLGAELFHAAEQTDMKLIVPSCNFANVPKTIHTHAHKPLSLFTD